MKDSWIEFLKNIDREITNIENTGSDTICFRGQADSKWDLEPSLLINMRKNKIKISQLNYIENVLYFDFTTNSNQLLKNNLTDWEILFTMRHHGIPTRVIDWTESFGNALYFALNGDGTSPTIWMFNPYEINKKTFTSETIPNPLRDLKYGYLETFIEKEKETPKDPIVIIPPRNSSRLFAQMGLFTLHGSINTPLNLNPKISTLIKKFIIPSDAIADARKFLKLSGINHYSIFPDLEGLAKHLTEKHNIS